MHQVSILCVWLNIALIQELIGEPITALQMAFEALIDMLKRKEMADEPLMPGLVFLPSASDTFEAIVSAEDGQTQAVLLLAEVIERSQRIFYNPNGQRMLHLVAQVVPHSPSTLLKLGISMLVAQQWGRTDCTSSSQTTCTDKSFDSAIAVSGISRFGRSRSGEFLAKVCPSLAS